MTRITLNDIIDVRELSTDEQKSRRGGNFNALLMLASMWGRPPVFQSFNYMPRNPYSNGYGIFHNVFTPGTINHGIMAATHFGQAQNDIRHNNFLANF